MPGPVVNNVLELVGNTPLVRLNRVTKGIRANIFAKLEYTNPGGSVKDRIGLAMVRDAEKRGLLKRGYTIVEPTSGNTGMGLALVALLSGYKIIFTVPDKMSRDKIDLLRAFGATVRVTPSKVPIDHPTSYVEVAKRITRERPRTFMPNQYENMANPDAHYKTTGQEIWQQTGGKVDVLVAGVGTGGTISGAARHLKEKKPEVRVVGVDPQGSILAAKFKGRSAKASPYKVEGIGEDFLPSTLDMSLIDKFVTVTDKEAFLMARRLAREEGIFAGGSAGAAASAAIKVARRLRRGETVVVILPDTGRSYLNKIYNDDWMAEEGFIKAKGTRVSVNDILLSKPRELRLVIGLSPDDKLSEAISKLTKFDISQLPVVQSGIQVGSVTVASVIKKVEEGAPLSTKVEEIMEAPLPTVERRTTLLDPAKLLKERNALVIVDGPKVVGVITTIDVINYLAKE